MKQHPRDSPTELPAEELQAAPTFGSPSRLSGLSGRLQAMAGTPVILVWVGLTFVAAGFGLLAFAWAKVAWTIDPGRQTPYILSGGFTAIGLILVGLTIAHTGMVRQSAVEQMNQVDRLRATFDELRSLVQAEASTSQSEPEESWTR